MYIHQEVNSRMNFIHILYFIYEELNEDVVFPISLFSNNIGPFSLSFSASSSSSCVKGAI